MVPPAGHGGSSSSSSSSQYTQQFLSSVLSQRGPSALPYVEDGKWLIRQHLVSLSDAYPALQPKTATFTHNDGRTVNLLQADGTVPMIFQNVTYNIPVVIWLMESYPRHPPLVFVNPTRDMIIKRPHPFVNPSGMVSIPYLQNWVYPSSNLLDLSRNLSHYFGRDPPLYSQRRPPQNPNPPPPTISLSPSFDLNCCNFDCSVNVVSFGFVAIAVLILMFLVMAIFERFLRARSSAAAAASRTHRDVEAQMMFHGKLDYPSPKDELLQQKEEEMDDYCSEL